MVGFYQALGVIAYISLISVIFWQGQNWFGHVPNFLGPFLMLSIFTTSVLICTLIVFGYPIKLYLATKKFKTPVKIVLHTAAWLAVFSLLIILGIILARFNVGD